MTAVPASQNTALMRDVMSFSLSQPRVRARPAGGRCVPCHAKNG
jgi:hypothetical protein